MRQIHPLILAACLVPAGAAQGADQLTRGPYLQQAAPTRMIVCWRGGEGPGRVHFGTNPAAPDQTAEETASPPPPLDHRVVLSGLSPATTYHYTVGTPGGILAASPDFQFTTPPVAGTAVPLRIWAMGDAGTGDIFQEQVRDAFRAWSGNRPPDFVLQLGDNAYYGGEDAEFQTAMFAIYQPELRRLPFWSCLGNHEIENIPAPGEGYPYFNIYDFPTAGECGGRASGTERYFSFDFGNTHVISLDTTLSDLSSGGAMATWLGQDLAATQATWILACFHHPPYTKGGHDSDLESNLIAARANILPILESGGVDLVLCGHSHSYERSMLLDGHYGSSTTLAANMIRNGGDGRMTGTGAYRKPASGPRGRHGTVYGVTGSAGLLNGGPLNHPAHRLSLNVLGSMAIDISGPRLDAAFITHTGTVADSFTILKQDSVDSDGDGMPDDYETLHGLDRLNPADALTDTDGDSAGNLHEYVFGRPASVPDIYPVVLSDDAGRTRVSFTSIPVRTYRVEWSNTLSPGEWQAGSSPMAGTGGTLSWTDPQISSDRRFYRVVATLP